MKWGSTQVGDPLLGSGARPIWHDGAGADRIQKVAYVAQDPMMCAEVRICYEGSQRDTNCGQCYKCVFNQACFWMAGVDAPEAFPTPATVAQVADLEFSTPYRIVMSTRLARMAAARGREDLAAALTTALNRAEAAAI